MNNDFRFMTIGLIVSGILGIALGMGKELPHIGYPPGSGLVPSQCRVVNADTSNPSLRCDKGPQSEVRVNKPDWQYK